AWALAMLRRGQPAFANFMRYVEAPASPARAAGFVDRHMTGPATWDVVARIREAWRGRLVLKGIRHVDDAVRAADSGAEGIILSNHGGRQSDAAPSPLDVVGAVSERLAGRIAIMLDGSVRSGLDILKCLVCGADFVFAGRPFLAAVAAMG